DKGMTIYLIRHGMTKGNEEKRYVGGRTDEDLSPAGAESLRKKIYPKVQQVFSSPMKRCIRTAEILYPGKEIFVVEEFRETDFGSFENKNYEELKGEKEYRDWLLAGGRGDFPGGEPREEVRKRVMQGFDKVMFKVWSQNLKESALIVHGGTIMHLMEAYGGEKKDFYEYQIGNGEYLSLSITEDLRGGRR
ncbi:MAG: histidine phosphatase family protein, partial [Lachnospiraceae bacterium]|nr:histidine phosphatase family protein [Lachnospiraceae bacterium]